MSKRFENGYVALVITCIVGLICIAIVSWTVPYSKGYQRADQDHQSAYTSDQAARESREECAKKATPQEAIECYDIAVTANREQQRAEQDLDAQREMANWAEGMLWATAIVGCLTVIVAGLGAYWVKETLSATREAVKAADDAVAVTRELGRAQVRAYVVIQSITVSDIAAGKMPKIKIDIANTGQSPAKDLKFRAFITFIEGDSARFRVRFRPGDKPSKFVMGSGVRNAQELTLDQVFTDAEVQSIRNGRLQLVVAVYLTYTTVFNQAKRTICRAYTDATCFNGEVGKTIATERGNRSN